jgi:predicted outer membrane repeat protein
MLNSGRRDSSRLRSNTRFSRLFENRMSLKSSGKKRKSLQHRNSRFEPLEERQLLSVTVNPSSDIGDTTGAAYVRSLTPNTQYDVYGEIDDGALGLNDIDLYAVSLDANQRLTLDIDTDFNGSQLDAYLRVFDSTGTPKTSNDNTHNNDPYLVYTAPSTGTYYVGVTNSQNSSYDPTDASGVPATNTGVGGEYSFKMTKHSLGASISLSNDTDMPGDDVTTDPTVSGSVAFFDDDGSGNLTTAYAEILFDNDNDGTAESTITINDPGGTFSYDPTSVSAGFSYGSPASLYYQLKEYDTSSTLAATSAWTPFSFDYVDDTLTNTAPILTLDATASGDEGSAITLSGSFTDPDSNSWTATVDFGDSSGTETITLNPDKTFTISHDYADEGTYTATVTLDDGVTGGTDTATVSVTAVNVVPEFRLDGLKKTKQNAAYELALSSPELGDDVMTQWSVNWGDGSSDIYTGSEAAATHVYNQGNLTRTISVSATSPEGTFTAGSHDVSVTTSDTLIVDSLADDVDSSDGEYTLREAILEANAVAREQRIIFDSALDFTTMRVITLTGGQMEISDSLSIEGPGDDKLTISGADTSRILYADTSSDPSNPVVDIAVSGMKLTAGDDAEGGAVKFIDLNTATFSDMSFIDNHSTTHGGAVYVEDTPSIIVDGVTADLNEADQYGGFAMFKNTVSIMVSNSTFTNNSGDYAGAFFAQTADAMQIVDSTFTDNTSDHYGGAVYAYENSVINVHSSLFTGNTAELGGAIGVILGSSVSLSGSTLANNGGEDTKRGGAIMVNAKELYAENTTIANNMVSMDSAAPGYGGGIYLYNTTVDARIVHSTITGNKAYHGGGIRTINADLQLQSSIVARNEVPKDSGSSGVGADLRISPALLAGSTNNLIGDGETATGLTHGVNGNQVGTTNEPIDPLFIEDANGDPLLADNGGPVPTVALQVANPATSLPGSPAIDAGATAYQTGSDSQLIMTDARGEERLCDTAIDVGAYEYVYDYPIISVEYGTETPSSFFSGDTVALGTVTYDEAIVLPFTIRNDGVDTLILDLDQISLPDGVRMTDEPFQFIEPGEEQALELTWDAQSSLVATTDVVTIPTNDPSYSTFEIKLSGTVTASNLPSVTTFELLFDSGTSQTDKDTTNPNVKVEVEGDLVRGYAVVEFDHDYTGHSYDGTADGSLFFQTSGDEFLYDPRAYDTTWPEPQTSDETVKLKYRLIHKNEFGRTLSTGTWTEFTFDLVDPTPRSSLAVSNLALASTGLIGDWTTPGAVAVTGQVDGSGTRYVQVAVDGMTLPTAVGEVDAQGTFNVSLPFGISYTTDSSVEVRAYKFVNATEEAVHGEMNLYGSWTVLNNVRGSLPDVESFDSIIDYSTEEMEETLPFVLKGSVSTTGLDAISSRYIEVELYYNDGSNDVHLGRTHTDGDSEFVLVPSGLPVGTTTVYARTVVRPEGEAAQYQNPATSESITYSVASNSLPSISSVTLTNPEIETPPTTSDPSLKAVTNVELGTNVKFQYSWKVGTGSYVTSKYASGTPVYDPEMTEETTHNDVETYFSIPGLHTGAATQAITVKVQAGRWDSITSDYVYGTETEYSFTYDKPANDAPEIETLAMDAKSSVEYPIIAGTVTNDGQLSGLLVEFFEGAASVGTQRTYADGSFQFTPLGLTPGSVTLTAKVREWNPMLGTSGDYQYSATENIEFIYAPLDVIAPVIESFELADDTGTTAGTTSNILLTGSLLDDGGDLNRVLIQFDYNPDNSIEEIDGYEYTDQNGEFLHLPTITTTNSTTYKVAARAIRSDFSGQDAASSWTTLEFIYADPTQSWTPEIDSLFAVDGVLNGSDVVSPNTAIGGLVTSEGGFANTVVQLDLDDDRVDVIEKNINADGSFYWTPDVTPDPSGDTTVLVGARAGEYDSSTQTTTWGSWANVEFTYHVAPADSYSTLDSFAETTNGDYVTDETDPNYGTTYQYTETHIISGDVTIGESVASVYIDLDYDNDEVADMSGMVGNDGKFEFYASPIASTVYVRIVDTLPDGTNEFGNWVSKPIVNVINPEELSPSIEFIPPADGVTSGLQVTNPPTSSSVTIAFNDLYSCDLTLTSGFISVADIESKLKTEIADPLVSATDTIWDVLPSGMNIGEANLLDTSDTEDVVVGTTAVPILKTDGLTQPEQDDAEDLMDDYLDAFAALQAAIDRLNESIVEANKGSSIQPPPESTTTDATGINDPSVTQADIDKLMNSPVPEIPEIDFGGDVPSFANDETMKTAIEGIVDAYDSAVETARDTLDVAFKATIAAYNERVEIAWGEYSKTYESLLDKLEEIQEKLTVDDPTTQEVEGENLFLVSEEYQKLYSDYETTVETAEDEYDDDIDDADVAYNAVMNNSPTWTEEQDALEAKATDYVNAEIDRQTTIAGALNAFRTGVAQGKYDLTIKLIKGDPAGGEGSREILKQMADAAKVYDTELEDAARDVVTGDGTNKGSAELVETYRNTIAEAWQTAVSGDPTDPNDEGVYGVILDAIDDWKDNDDTVESWSDFVVDLIEHAKTEADTIAGANTTAASTEASAERDASEELASANHAWNMSMKDLRYRISQKMIDRDAEFQLKAARAERDAFLGKDGEDGYIQVVYNGSLDSIAPWEDLQVGADANTPGIIEEFYDMQRDLGDNPDQEDKADAYYALDLVWMDLETTYYGAVATEADDLDRTLNDLIHEREETLILAAEEYWKTSVSIGVEVEESLLNADFGFADAYNKTADDFSDEINQAAKSFDGTAVGASETRASDDEDSESSFIGDALDLLFTTVDTAYSEVSGAFGSLLNSDKDDVQDYVLAEEYEVGGLITDLLGDVFGAVSSAVTTIYDMADDGLTALDSFASGLLNTSKTIENSAIKEAKTLAMTEIQARVTYLNAISDADWSERDRAIDRTATRRKMRTDYGLAAASDHLEKTYEGIIAVPPQNTPDEVVLNGYTTPNQNTVFVPSSLLFLPSDFEPGENDPVPDWSFDAVGGSIYAGFGGVSLVNEMYYSSSQTTSYEFGMSSDGFGPLDFGAKEYSPGEVWHGWAFDAYEDYYKLLENRDSDQIDVDRQDAATAYATSYYTIFQNAGEGAEGFVGQYLGSDLSGLQSFNGDLVQALSKANTSFAADAVTFDPTSDVIDYAKASASNGRGLLSGLGENFGDFQVGWRNEDQADDETWASDVADARDGYFDEVYGMSGASETFTDAFYGGIETFSNTMRDASISLSTGFFNADMGYATDSLATDSTWIQDRFAADSNQRLDYLAAAVEEAKLYATEESLQKQSLATASALAVTNAAAYLDPHMNTLPPTDFDTWTSAAQSDFASASAIHDSEETARPDRVTASGTALSTYATTLANDRADAESDSDADHVKESKIADLLFMTSAMTDATGALNAYAGSIEGWTDVVKPAEKSIFATLYSAAESFTSEVNRLTGLFFNAVDQISNGDAIQAAMYYSTGSSDKYTDAYFADFEVTYNNCSDDSSNAKSNSSGLEGIYGPLQPSHPKFEELYNVVEGYNNQIEPFSEEAINLAFQNTFTPDILLKMGIIPNTSPLEKIAPPDKDSGESFIGARTEPRDLFTALFINVYNTLSLYDKVHNEFHDMGALMQTEVLANTYFNPPTTTQDMIAHSAYVEGSKLSVDTFSRYQIAFMYAILQSVEDGYSLDSIARAGKSMDYRKLHGHLVENDLIGRDMMFYTDWQIRELFAKTVSFLQKEHEDTISELLNSASRPEDIDDLEEAFLELAEICKEIAKELGESGSSARATELRRDLGIDQMNRIESYIDRTKDLRLQQIPSNNNRRPYRAR